MLTELQKRHIDEIIAARDAANAADRERQHAAAASEAARNLYDWKPVISTALSALPEWFIDDIELKPYAKLPNYGHSDWTYDTDGYRTVQEQVSVLDADGGELLRVCVVLSKDGWTLSDYPYMVIYADGDGGAAYSTFEAAAVRLSTEQERRAELQRMHADREQTEDREAHEYAERQAQHEAQTAAIAAERAARDAERKRSDDGIVGVINGAAAGIVNCDYVLDGGGKRDLAETHLKESIVYALIAIARILNDMRQEYRRNNCNDF